MEESASSEIVKLQLASEDVDIMNGLEDCFVAAYDAPEDHPLYKTVDGVLFSKDGKTLLAYPNARTATHYDVPAGVERIGNGAFGNEYLKTISLPIGLKSVGDYAFSGCTRLQSIALPLTVKEIGKGIFNEGVSLELVSLPEGMEAELMSQVLKVRLRGPAAVMKKLTAQDIKVVVDFSGKELGSFTIKPTITVSGEAFANVGAVGSYSVSATLREIVEETTEEE